MTPLEHLPPTLQRLADAATTVGWTVNATAADGPPPTVVLRFASPDGDYRAFALWRTDKGVNFHGAAARHVPPGRFTTLTALKAYLGIPA